MITTIAVILAAYLGGIITGADAVKDEKKEELRQCYERQEQRYRALPRSSYDSNVAVGEKEI